MEHPTLQQELDRRTTEKRGLEMNPMKSDALRKAPAEGKVYCPVVGLVEDGTVVLVEQGAVPE